MTVSVNVASATIGVAADHAVADQDIGPHVVRFHLTQGYSSQQGITGDAIFATGHVGVSLGPGDTLDDWDFGFIQLVRQNFLGLFYAGRMSSEGSVGMLAHLPPAMPQSLWLDSKPAFRPWTRSSPRFNFLAPQVHASTSDHPALQAENEKTNPVRAGVTNYLFHVVDNREFWSVFTAIGPRNRVLHLAHFHWSLRYDVKFSWRSGKPVVARKQSDFPSPGPFVKGPPADAQLQSFLANPVGAQYNDALTTALSQAKNGPTGPNRRENPTWFNNVPGDFYQ